MSQSPYFSTLKLILRQFALCALVISAPLFLSSCRTQPQGSAATPSLPEMKSNGSVKAVTEPLIITESVARALNPGEGFLLGVDRARVTDFKDFRYKRLALVTNSTAVDSLGITTAERLLTSKRVTLARILHVTDNFSSPTLAFNAALALRPAVQTVDLTPASFRPDKAMLDGIDMIIVDLALRGPRFEFDTAVLGATLEEAALSELPIVIFDRPNLLDSDMVLGPFSDPDVYGERTAFFAIPASPGLTAGELAKAMNVKYGIQADLKVYTMNHWKHADGNAWLANRPESDVSEKGAANLAELRESRFFNTDLLMLHGVMVLLSEEEWQAEDVRLNEAGQAELVAVPKLLDAVTVLERLSSLAPAGVDMRPGTGNLDGTEVPAIIVESNGKVPVEMVTLGLQLNFAAVPSARAYPWPENGGPLRSREIYQLYRRGRDADQVARRFTAAPELADYLQWRKGALLYEP